MSSSPLRALCWLLAAAGVVGCGARQRVYEPRARETTVATGTCANPVSDGVVGSFHQPDYRTLDLNDDLIPELLVADRTLCDNADNCYWNVFTIDTSGDCLPYTYAGTIEAREIELLDDTGDRSFRSLQGLWHRGEGMWSVKTYRFAATHYTTIPSAHRFCWGDSPKDAQCMKSAATIPYARGLALRPVALPAWMTELSLAYATWSTAPEGRAGATLGSTGAAALAGRLGTPRGELYGELWVPVGDDPELFDGGMYRRAIGVRIPLDHMLGLRAEWGSHFRHDYHAYTSDLVLGLDVRYRIARRIAAGASFYLDWQTLDFRGSMETGQDWKHTDLLASTHLDLDITPGLSMSASVGLALAVKQLPSEDQPDRRSELGYLDVPVRVRPSLHIQYSLFERMDLWSQLTLAPQQDSEQQVLIGVRLRR